MKKYPDINWNGFGKNITGNVGKWRLFNIKQTKPNEYEMTSELPGLSKTICHTSLMQCKNHADKSFKWWLNRLFDKKGVQGNQEEKKEIESNAILIE